MSKTLFRYFCVLLTALGLLAACSDDSGSSSDAADTDAIGDSEDGDTAIDPRAASLMNYCGSNWEAVEQRIDETIPELTLEEKVSLMHGTFPLPTDGTWSTDGIEDHGVPGFDMLDGPRGLSKFSDRTGTAFPVGMSRGATWNPALEREVGRVIGGELRLAGANVLLAPTVNILRHPRWGRAQETYGEDPLHMGVMGAAFVEGAQEHVMAVAKHYAANSIEDTRLEVNVTASERTLREIYLPHFRRIVQEAGSAGIMSAYNQVNGEWASEQDHLLGDVLRGEWGFEGFVVSDFIWGTHNTVPALEAGLDVEMPIDEIYGSSLVDAVTNGDADEALVDASVRRILRAQWCFEESTTDPAFSEIEGEAALTLAREAAVQGMVLLENREDALPVDRSSAPTIAVVGSLADAANTGDRGSSHVESSEVISMLEGLQAAAGDATVVHVPGDLSETADREAVSSADVVIAVVGYTEDEEGEGQIAAGDREILSLPDDDKGVLGEAASLNDRVVTVIIGGSSVTMEPWGDDVEAIMMAWYAGAQGGHALAEVVYGETNFSGRLPISFAAEDEHHPPFDNVSLEVTYGYFHGYRHLQNEGHDPLYPFGYGLSYTSFDYANPSVSVDGDVVNVSVDVTNSGDVDGVEVVQVYVGAPGEAVERAPRDLRAFERAEVASGETETVTFEVPVDELRYFDEETMAWVLEPGEYTVEIARNVRDIELSETIELE
jgi:beta-glucosidase